MTHYKLNHRLRRHYDLSVRSWAVLNLVLIVSYFKLLETMIGGVR